MRWSRHGAATLSPKRRVAFVLVHGEDFVELYIAWGAFIPAVITGLKKVDHPISLL